ncbi:hypothetical protein SEA_ZENITSU_34 [Microbacterium phage Zenitsu]|nr:hypothetical protein SEA_ZENITSU_34 [Microbacterium phage Zenitsu]WNN95828.1 hypothetical protein SEA_CHIKPIC_34 [Microbacterium phage ChikPic]
MAKKIRLDFTKVEERSGWNTKGIPEGLHRMKIASVEEKEAQDGTDMLVYALVPTDPRYKARRFPFYCKLQQNQLWKLRDLLVAAGISVPKKALNIDPNSPVGKEIAVEVSDEVGQYAGRSTVDATYDLSVLDDEDGSAPDDDDEEYEDEEGDDYDEADEAEDEEDEEDEGEDLSTLTLPELRKLAKSLGIDTNGVKKADLIEMIEEEQEADEDDEDDLDEDDLDDEELEDEEFEDDEDEDEEEEPEEAPAPKRRAPAKKTAAPARKRVVKRR